MTLAILYGCFKFGFTLGLIAWFALIGFIAPTAVMGLLGYAMVMGVMRGNESKP